MSGGGGHDGFLHGVRAEDAAGDEPSGDAHFLRHPKGSMCYRLPGLDRIEAASMPARVLTCNASTPYGCPLKLSSNAPNLGLSPRTASPRWE